METIVIKRVNEEDISDLREIGMKTFYQTFASFNTEANIRQYLDEKFSFTQLSNELKNGHSQFYFALMGGRVVGYLKLNQGSAQTESLSDRSLEIERIYVLQEFQSKKVGQELYGKAMEVALQEGVDYVWLGVWEENKKAIGFYMKNGFIAFDQHVFRLGDDEQTDILMKKMLRAE